MVGAGGRRADAVMDLTASDGSRAVLVLEAKRSVVIRDLSAVVSQLETISGQFVSQAAQVVSVVVARYLAPPAREWLQERGVSYESVMK